ncbi:MAG: CDP-diacylglycerol--glycerol-3-phosphate 3-phosphatidyltransferase [Candidatus Omnitrophica bacterium]|nr:CDP-diacylglycerol--glycerol-3-phosphate 3-phosphatidyltransferase [Candidatus Omnitrophota bacterium]
MNLPNKLTVTRIILSFIFIIFIFSQGFLAKTLAFAVFLIASLTDFFDGYIARKYNLITDLGKLLDPIADKILVLAAFSAFVYMRIIPVWMLVIIIFRELLITGIRLVLARKGKVIAASIWGKYKTVGQMIAIFIILSFIVIKEAGTNKYDFWSQAWQISSINIINFVMYITIGLTLVSGISYFLKNKNEFKN